MVTHTDEKEVALIRKSKDAEMQTCAELKKATEGAQPDAAMSVWPADGGLKSKHGVIHPRAL